MTRQSSTEICLLAEAAPLDTMRRLYDAGFSLIPLGGPDGKRPLVSGWTGHRLPLETVIKRMQKAGSTTYGIQLNGLCVVDCDTDNAESRQLVLERFGSTPVMVRTARGIHYYFKAGDKVPSSIRQSGIAIDFKTGNSSLVVGPGSIRPDGVVYMPTGEPLLSPGSLPVFRDKSPPERTYGGKIAKGHRNTGLSKHARQLAPCCDSEQEIFDNLIGFRNLECEDPDSVPDREVQAVAAWAWKLRCENRLWEGRNSVVRLNRLVLDRLAQHKHGADALLLYSIVAANHGHIPGKKFAIVPDAMIENGLIPFPRSRVYRAIFTLIEVDLLGLAKKGRVREPNLYRLSHPTFPSNQGGEGLSITLVSNTGHGERLMENPNAGYTPNKMLPAQKDLTISESLLPALHEAIDEAMQKARDWAFYKLPHEPTRYPEMRNVRLDETMRLRVSPAFKANVEAEADRRGATVSQLVRQALNELLDKRVKQAA